MVLGRFEVSMPHALFLSWQLREWISYEEWISSIERMDTDFTNLS